MLRRERTSRGLALSLIACTALAGACLAQPAQADEKAAAGASTETSGPANGMHMSAVEARYGAPAQRHDAVGKPPITRWDYPGFVVFFENDLVLHSVILRPAA